MPHLDSMETIVVVLVITQLVIAAAAGAGARWRVPPPLILVAAGIGTSLIPGLPNVTIDPQIILLGLLPPLLYATASSIPVMNLRREFSAVNALSIALVVVTSLALGGLFVLLIPGLGYGWGVALGAILSPTDAVATSIIKGRGVPGRVALILDGESLLNDASALVVLRTAIVATSLGFSFWPTLGSFALSVGIAILVGMLAARTVLAIRRRVRDEAVGTILSFTTPFLAAVPTELLHGSGLVAAVVAGFVVGTRGPRDLPPTHRVSDARTWATVELGAEGVVFLTMGLQLSAIVAQLGSERIGLGSALGIALLALLATVLLRAAFVAPLLGLLSRRARLAQAQQSKILAMKAQWRAAGGTPEALARLKPPPAGGPDGRWVERFKRRGRRYLADIDYLSRQPLGRAETVLVIWAGMRGAVTVAAAQLLPASTPHRPLLVFIAFAVAAASLLVQGGTVGLLVSRLFAQRVPVDDPARPGDLARIAKLLQHAREPLQREDGTSDKDHRLRVLRAQRHALLDARDDGLLDADVLERALRDVDIDEMVLELRSDAVRP